MTKKEIASEGVEIAGKILLSAIPIGGVLATCVWDSIKAHSVQYRLDEWKRVIEDRLTNVERTLEDIGGNELFASAMMRSTDIAIKTAESDKREYLANAVYNSLEIHINESIMMMYLNMLEEYTVWHIKILNYFRNPLACERVNANNYMMGSAMGPLLQVFPELIEKKEIVNKIVKDFQKDGLLSEGSYLTGTMTNSGMVAARTTVWGNEFLEFITENK